MVTLALDTTTRAGSAAVLRDDAVLAIVEGEAARTHGERLPGELDEVLRRAGVTLGDVDLLAVARGPGAFTGLRIGLAAMQGLAMVTGRPVVGISALDALAADAFDALGRPHVRIGAWMDAARGEVFAAAYDAEGEPGGLATLVPLAGPDVGDPDAVWARWQALPADSWWMIGDGAARYSRPLANVALLDARHLAPTIGRLARRQVGTGTYAPHELQPLYVRRPDAERSRRP
jgi:tRNA threonylcarbamoyladenosine biosynthesis protein TsaB